MTGIELAREIVGLVLDGLTAVTLLWFLVYLTIILFKD